jgi:Arc/MetJ-type ribon-helix-helix transcriptional regulator
MEVTLNSELMRWIEELMSSGRYVSADQVIETALYAMRDTATTEADEIAQFSAELDRRLASLDRGESFDPEIVRADLARRSAERRRKTA